MNLRPSGYEPDELPAAPSRDVKCLGPELNRHGAKPQRILSPLCLPVPPPRQHWFNSKDIVSHISSYVKRKKDINLSRLFIGSKMVIKTRRFSFIYLNIFRRFMPFINFIINALNVFVLFGRCLSFDELIIYFNFYRRLYFDQVNISVYYFFIQVKFKPVE